MLTYTKKCVVLHEMTKKFYFNIVSGSFTQWAEQHAFVGIGALPISSDSKPVSETEYRNMPLRPTGESA
jgi:hypothetical protein